MCGIAAIVELRGGMVDRSALKRMTDSLLHRGPDDEGFYIEDWLGLGFRRLAIIDLTTASHQPMVSRDGSLVIVFNGEIYNFIELREELQGLGHTFETRGDTEVLLHAFQQWGKDCLSRLNGMWAFLIYDRRQRTLFGARDRFGVKPLYWYCDADRMLLASEIKAIRASGYYRDTVNWRTSARFLHAGELNTTPDSFFEGIQELPSGSMFELATDGAWTVKRYWMLPDHCDVSLPNPIECYRDLFVDAVRLRMRSDVPVGVCLSGGLDSTSILCEMARIRNASTTNDLMGIQAFCFIDKEFDEARYIDDTINQTKAVLNRFELSPLELWGSLEKVLWYHDEPVHSLNVPIAFELMRIAASKGVKVLLNGQGSDESAAGYFSYFGDYWASLILNGRMHKVWEEIGQYTAMHAMSRPALLMDAGLKAIARRLSGWTPYRLAKSLIPTRDHSDNWLSNEFLRSQFVAEERETDFSLHRILQRSVEYAPLPLYLRIEDRNSMANSVEGRLPFMDYRLVSLLFQLPDSYKLRGPWNKYIQREALRGMIPESVRARADKMGFPTPKRRWIAHDLYEPIADILHSQACRERGIYQWRAMVNDLERHRHGETDISYRLLHVVQFELWNQMQVVPRPL